MNQLKDAPPSLVIEAYPKNARSPNAATLVQAAENRDVLLGADKRDPTKFRLVYTLEMGSGRKTGKKSPGFIDSILNLIEAFYGSVVLTITPWTPKAPKITAPAPAAASNDDGDRDHDRQDNRLPSTALTWSSFPDYPHSPATPTIDRWSVTE